jgi:hypothetical protein
MPRRKQEEEGEGFVTDTFKFLTGSYPGEKSVKKLLNEHGDAKIKSIKIGRDPVGSAITTVLNLVAAGKFNQAKKDAGYDKLFHLFMVVELSDGSSFRIEKNEKFTIGNPNWTSKTETMNAPVKPISLMSFINTAIAKVGSKDFFTYTAFKDNCQAFIKNLLQANGMLTPELDKFIFQDVELLEKDLPKYVSKSANVITDVAASIKSLFTGKGIKKGMPKGSSMVLEGEDRYVPVGRTHDTALSELQAGERVPVKRRGRSRQLNYSLAVDHLQAGESAPIQQRSIKPTRKSKEALAYDRLQDIPLNGMESLKGLVQHVKQRQMQGNLKITKGEGIVDTIKNIAGPVLKELLPNEAMPILEQLQNPDMDPKLRMGILKLVKLAKSALPKLLESPVKKLEGGGAMTHNQAMHLMKWIHRMHKDTGQGLYHAGEKPSAATSSSGYQRLMEENQRLKKQLMEKEGKGMKRGKGLYGGGPSFDGVGLYG